MKTKLVDTVTTNEDHVRLRIFDGDLQISEAAAELLRVEKSQRAADRRCSDLLASRYANLSRAAHNAYGQLLRSGLGEHEAAKTLRPFLSDFLLRNFYAGNPDVQPPKFETTNQQQEK